MNGQRTPRRRETILVLFVTIALAFAVTLFALMITGRLFLAMVAVAAGMVILGFLQYLIWGWPMERNHWPTRRDTTHLPR